MTAIAAVCTPEGFVIGADGRQTNKGILITDKKQKIFGSEAVGIQAAYGFAGCVKFGSSLGEFDVLVESQNLLYELRPRNFRNLTDYAMRFAKDLYTRIAPHSSNVNNLSYLQADEFVSFLMVGHVKNAYEVSAIAFPLENGIVKEPVVKCALSDPFAHFTMIGGYPEVYTKMQESGITEPCSTAAKGAGLVKRFIDECVDNSSLFGDEIGGHVHIAKVTPFESTWMICPKP
jgi:hypothetical protein